MNQRLLWFFGLPPILLFVIFPLRLHGYINPHDEGVWLATAQAMLEGKRLYRDIWLQYNPILPCIVNAVVSTFRPTLSLIRGLFWGLNALGLFGLSCVAARLIKTERLRLMLILFLWMAPSAAFTPMIPMAARYAAGFLPMLFWPIQRSAPEDALPGNGWAAGLLAGLAFWIAQEVGTAALLAGLFVFVMDRQEKRGAMGYALGALSVLITGLVMLSVRDGLSAYLQAAVFQTASIVNVERLPLPTISRALLAQTWSGNAPWINLWEKMAEALALYLPALTYAAVLLWSAAGRERFRGWKGACAGLALYGLLAASSAWGRTDRWHIYFSLSPALLLWAFMADHFAPRRDKVNSVLFLLFLLAGGLLTIPPYIGTGFRQRLYQVNQRPTSLVRAGTSRLPFWQANGYEALVRWIQSHVRPGEPFLFFPYNGAIYFLADRPNPTRLPILALGVRLDMQDQAIREIENAQVRWVIRDSENKDFDGVPIDRFLSHLADYIQTHYTERQKLGPFVFMERNGVS